MHRLVAGEGRAEVGQLRQVVTNGIRHREAALGGQQQNGGAGELLADEGDAETRLRADGPAMFDVGEAGAFVQRQRAAVYQRAFRSKGLTE